MFFLVVANLLRGMDLESLILHHCMVCVKLGLMGLIDRLARFLSFYVHGCFLAWMKAKNCRKFPKLFNGFHCRNFPRSMHARFSKNCTLTPWLLFNASMARIIGQTNQIGPFNFFDCFNWVFVGSNLMNMSCLVYLNDSISCLFPFRVIISK